MKHAISVVKRGLGNVPPDICLIIFKAHMIIFFVVKVRKDSRVHYVVIQVSRIMLIVESRMGSTFRPLCPDISFQETHVFLVTVLEFIPQHIT